MPDKINDKPLNLSCRQYRVIYLIGKKKLNASIPRLIKHDSIRNVRLNLNRGHSRFSPIIDQA